MVNRAKRQTSTKTKPKTKKSAKTTKKKSTIKSSPKTKSNTRTLLHYFSPVPSSQESSSSSSLLPSPLSTTSLLNVSSPSSLIVPSSPRSTIRNSSTSLNQFMNSVPSTPPPRKDVDKGTDIFIHTDGSDTDPQASGLGNNSDKVYDNNDTTTTTMSKPQVLPTTSRPRTRLATLNSNVLVNSNDKNESKGLVGRETNFIKKRNRDNAAKEDGGVESVVTSDNSHNNNKRQKISSCDGDGNAKDPDSDDKGKKRRGNSKSTSNSKNEKNATVAMTSSATESKKRSKSSSTSTKKRRSRSPNKKNRRKPNNSENGIQLGLIRVNSVETTLYELCTSLYQIMNRGDDSNDDADQSTSTAKPTIYPLFEGAVLGRNERISKDPKKIDIDIPVNENGISRKQLLVSAIEWEVEQGEGGKVDCADLNQNQTTSSGNSATENISICKETHPNTLMAYLENQQRICPKVEMSCSPGALNSVRIAVRKGAKEVSRPVLKPSKCLMLKVGDMIEFDYYKGKEKFQNIDDKCSKMPSFTYRVVAFKAGREKKDNPDDQSTKPKILKRVQPSRRAKDILDKTIDISLECDDNDENDNEILNTSTLSVSLPEAQQTEKMEAENGTRASLNNDNWTLNETVVIGAKEQEQNQNLIGTSGNDVNKLTEPQIQEKESTLTESTADDKKLKMHNDSPDRKEVTPSAAELLEDEMETHEEDKAPTVQQKQTEAVSSIELDHGKQTRDEDEESDGESDFHDDEVNYSQDSFFDSPIESLAQKQRRMEKPVEMPSMMSNYLWRALNSAEPQNGFGFFMHMGSVLNAVPNGSLARSLSEYMLNGPFSDGTHFKDCQRTELTGTYIEFVMKKLIHPGSKINFNIAPSSWEDMEVLMSLPHSETKDIKFDTTNPNPQSVRYIAQTLQQSATSLKLLALNLELELKSAIESPGDATAKKSLYSDLPLVGLVLKNEVRKSLKNAVRLATSLEIEHGYWLFGRLNEGRRICRTSEEELCAIETKSCLSSMGSIISHLAWLYAAEEGVEFASQDCCFLIRDAMMAELDGMHFSRYGQPEKKATAAARKKLLSSLKLEFLLSLETIFSQTLQLKLGETLRLSRELSVLGI